MCLDEVDCDLKCSDLRRKSYGRSMTSCHRGTCTSMYVVIARAIAKILNAEMGDSGWKMNIHGLIGVPLMLAVHI